MRKTGVSKPLRSPQQNLRRFSNISLQHTILIISMASKMAVADWFSSVGKIPDDRGFHCFQTIPDFADIPESSCLTMTYAILIGEAGDWSKAMKKIDELKLSPTSSTDHIKVSICRE